ncbi:MAG: hypothetical protein M1552_02005 [Firmicutes bacterium]|nr:hypothetical protein [Bacillota bacterium]
MSKIVYNESSAVTKYPPCQGGCPVHTDVQEYVRQIAVGDYDKAVAAITAPNPLASVCGMICAHPCETECRRKDVDEAVSIRALKRFALENGYRPSHPGRRPAAHPRVGYKTGSGRCPLSRYQYGSGR